MEPAVTRPAYVAAFRLQDAGPTPGGEAEAAPRTQVEFVLHSASAPSVVTALGTEAGGCVDRPPHEGELLRVSCWWGPEESHWVARRESWGVALLRAEGPRESLPESASDGSQEAWELRERLSLPSGTVVSPLGP